MKRAYFFLILTIALLPVILADTTTVLYDEWIYGNESFTAGPLTIQLTEDRDNKAVAFDYDDGTVLVTNNTCEVRPKYIFCVDDTREGDFDYWWRYYRWEYNIRVEEKVATLVLTRSLSHTDILLGQYIDIEMTLENTGSVPATDIHFEDVFDDFEIVLTENCLRGENAVVWDGILQPEESLSCTYRILSIKETDTSPTATVTYSYGDETATETDSQDIKVHSSKLVVSASQLDMEVGETKVITIFLNNTSPDDIFVKRLTINIPYGLRLQRYKNWNKLHDYKLQYAGSVIAGSTRVLNFTLSAERAREYIIGVETDYDVQGTPAISDTNITIDVVIPQLEIDYNLPDAVQGEIAPITVNIRNPSTLHTFSGVDVKLLIPCINVSVAKLFNEIAPTESLTVYDQMVTLPSAGDCGLQSNLLYETQYDQQMRSSQNASFTILETAPAPEVEVDAPEVIQVAPVEQATAPTFAERFESSSNLIRYVVIGAVVLILLFVVVKVFRRKRPEGISRKELQEVEEVIQAKEGKKDEEEEAPGPEEEPPEEEDYEPGEPKRDDNVPATSKRKAAPTKVRRTKSKNPSKKAQSKKVKKAADKKPQQKPPKELADNSFRF